MSGIAYSVKTKILRLTYRSAIFSGRNHGYMYLALYIQFPQIHVNKYRSESSFFFAQTEATVHKFMPQPHLKVGHACYSILKTVDCDRLFKVNLSCLLGPAPGNNGKIQKLLEQHSVTSLA